MSDRLELLPKHDSHHGYGAGREFPRHKSELVLGNSHLFDDIPKSKKKVNLGNQNENEELISLSAANGNVTLPKSYLESGGHFPAKDAYINTLKTQFFSLGLSSGAALQMFIVSFVIMFVSTSNNAGPIQELSHEYYAVFRGVFLISFFFCLYGANLFIWRRMKIDYSHILGVSYAHTYQYVLRGSSTVAYVTCTSFLLFIMTITGGLDSFGNKNVLKHVWPALTVFLPIILFVCPIDWLTQGCFGVTRHGFQQRYSLLKELAAIVCSPFSDVTFFRSFVADVLTSMPKVFPDLQYTLCLYSTMSFFCDREENWRIPHAYNVCGVGHPAYYWIQLVLSFAPLNIRFWQCVRSYIDSGNQRQIFNAIKYLLSMSVTALAKARTSFDPLMNEKLGNVWVGLGVVATLYSVYWDVCIDWGLGSLRSQNLLLRDSLHFAPSTYYVAIALNFVMRLGWALIISPDQPYLQQHYILVLGAVELLRRFQWAIFRVEWEHTQHWEKANKPHATTNMGAGAGAALCTASDDGHRHRELHKRPIASARHAFDSLHHETNEALRHHFHSSESLSDHRHLEQHLFFEEVVQLEVMHAEGEVLTDDRDESGDARAVFNRDRGLGLGLGVGSARQETELTDRDLSTILA